MVFVPVQSATSASGKAPRHRRALAGWLKEKELVAGLLRNLRRLRERFGRVHVNLGEPIFLEQLLERHAPDWRRYTGDAAERPRWVGPVIDELARGVMRNINSAASMTPVSLLALALLATPRHMDLRSQLLRQLETLLAALAGGALQRACHADRAQPAAIVDYGRKAATGLADTDLAGEFVRMSPDNAVLATYYRNNVLHLVALPSLVACCFIANAVSLGAADIQRFARRVYPDIAAELSLRWREDEAPAIIGPGAGAGADRAARGGGGGKLAAAGAEFAGGNGALAAGAGHTAYYRRLLPGHRAAGARRQRHRQPEGARAALPADGAAHDAAVRFQLARILRPRAVRQLHHAAALAACCGIVMTVIRLRGVRSNRDGLGAMVVVTGASGRRQWNRATTTAGYGSSSDRTVFFGMGSDKVAASVEVIWPGGARQTERNVACDRYLALVEP